MKNQKIFFILFILMVGYQLLTVRCFASEPKKIILDNGLTLIHKENKSNEIIAIDLFIKAGNRIENDDQAGITNFIQRLLLKGTRTRTAEQLALEIESMGGIINTATDDDYAEIYLIITREHFDKGLEILFDVVRNPSFLNGEIEKERSLILAQIKSKQDSIFATTYDLFNEALYGKYPYHKPTSGNEKTVSAIGHQDLINFHKQIYTPENMVLVVVGNVKENKVSQIITKIFDLRKNSSMVQKTHPENTSTEKSLDELIPQRETFYKQTYRKKFKQAYLMLGYLLPEGSSPDYPALKVINAVLGGGMGSRLFLNLRDKEGLTYEIGAFYPTRILKSKFVIYLGLDAQNINIARQKILEELQKLQEQSLSEIELKEIKNYLKGTFILEHQTNKQQAWYLGWYEIIGKGYLYDTLYSQELQKVTAEDISRTAKKYFQVDNWIAIEIMPEAK